MRAEKFSRAMHPSVSTAEALALAVSGEDSALNDLLRHYLPTLKRSAHGRLPASARGGADTDDIVQDALLGFIKRLEHFRSVRPGALLAFIRLSVKNRVRDEVRRVARRPVPSVKEVADLSASGRSPFQEAELAETAVRFEQALASLREPDRRVIAGVELGYSYQELAGILGKPTANSARVAAVRALNKLVTVMEVRLVAPSRRRTRPRQRIP